MLAWLAPIIVLGIVVFVHELGHFLAAKALGVYAPRFALGWGPAIVRWRAKGAETEYVIAALPIGGYVRMASKEDEAAALLEGGSHTVRVPVVDAIRHVVDAAARDSGGAISRDHHRVAKVQLALGLAVVVRHGHS